eukprot:scaffold3735_cov367-Prasinococcus_capsulatus_cf.AAC.6
MPRGGPRPPRARRVAAAGVWASLDGWTDGWPDGWIARGCYCSAGASHRSSATAAAAAAADDDDEQGARSSICSSIHPSMRADAAALLGGEAGRGEAM